MVSKLFVEMDAGTDALLQVLVGEWVVWTDDCGSGEEETPAVGAELSASERWAVTEGSRVWYLHILWYLKGSYASMP